MTEMTKRLNDDIKIGGKSPDFFCNICFGAGTFVSEENGASAQSEWEYCPKCTEAGEKESEELRAAILQAQSGGDE